MTNQIYISFSNALQQENGGEAIDLADSYLDELSDQTAIDTAREAAAQRLLNREPISQEITNKARDVFETAKTTRQLRAENATLVQALSRGQLDFEAGAAKVDELASAQETLDSAFQDLKDSGGLDALGPLLIADGEGLLEIQKESVHTDSKQNKPNSSSKKRKNSGKSTGPPTGSVVKTEATLKIRNVGGTVAEDLDVFVSETPLSGVTVEPSTIKSIEPDSETTLEITVDRDNPAGRYGLTVQVGSGRIGVSDGIQIVVADKQHYVDNAISKIRELKDVFEAVESETNRSLRSVYAILNKSLDDLEEVTAGLQDGSLSSKHANQQMFSAKQRLNGLSVQISGLKPLSGAEKASLQSEVSGLTDVIERGIAAGK